MQGATYRLRVRAMGVAEIALRGSDDAPEPLSAPLGMKAQAMIAYLADAAPRPVAREALVELLWERVGAVQGKGSLRQEIRRVKRAFGDAAFAALFDVTDHHIAIAPDALDYDVAALERAAASEDADVAAEILSLYGGEFLSDNAARADAFQNWARERRTALNDLAVAALVRLSAADLTAGRERRAQEAADRVIAIDPLHEGGHESRIRCHIASGRRAEARAHFERFRKLMLRELAEEPSAELAVLVNPDAPSSKPRAARAAGRGPSRPVVAVLDVSPKAGGDQAYLAAGVAEELVANLSKSAWFKVASLNVATLSPGLGDVDRAQRDLRDYADYVLRLDIRVAGERAAILATLSRVADGETVFSDRMDDRIEDLLALQRRVALRIASIFEPMVLDDQSARAAAEARFGEQKDFDHWRLVMKAHWLFWTTTPKNNKAAQALLARALKAQPGDVPALCLLGFSHMLDAWADWSGDVDGSVAEAQ
ncbi:MAG: BTAD domain-containing putative transcriptional regulator, partial [Pseudomonadota bacterium]